MQLQLFVLCLCIRKHLLRVGKVAALKIYRYRYRYRGKSLFTYRLLTELKIPLPYISDLEHQQQSGAKIWHFTSQPV